MEQALEKVFDQHLVKNRIADVTHANMVAHLVCNEFEVWQWLDWKSDLGGMTWAIGKGRMTQRMVESRSLLCHLSKTASLRILLMLAHCL